MARPNIILILSDSHRWDCSGYAGNPDVRTPNLDVLAKHGVTFDQAICQCPLCAPARSTIFTGQYPAGHGVHDNGQPLSPDSPKLPEVLRDLEYHTAAVGHMHFTPPRAAFGFDELKLAEQDGPGRSSDDYHAWLAEQGLEDEVDAWDQVDRSRASQAYLDNFGALRSNLADEHYSSTWIGRQAVRFLQSAREPFFLCVGFIKPHHPFDPPAPWDRTYDPSTLTLLPGYRESASPDDRYADTHFDLSELPEPVYRRVLAHYYGAISHMDYQIGRIMATLGGRGHTNNIIVYTSDHGEYMGHHGLLFKNGPPYDPVIRVPLLISGLARQRKGEHDPALAQHTDILPTLVEAAGGTMPDGVDGTSLMPQLLESGRPLRDIAYCERRGGTTVARTATHKLVESEQPSSRAFYDLDQDAQEFQNILGNPAVVRHQVKLTKSLRKYRLEIDRARRSAGPADAS